MREVKINKELIINSLNELAKSRKEFNLKDIANNLGYIDMSNEDCIDIAKSFIKKNPEFKAVQIGKTNRDDLFKTLVFSNLIKEVNNNLENDNDLEL